MSVFEVLLESIDDDEQTMARIVLVVEQQSLANAVAVVVREDDAYSAVAETDKETYDAASGVVEDWASLDDDVD